MSTPQKLRNRWDKMSVPEKNSGEKVTQQNMKAEADINNITARYLKTGVLGNPGGTRQAIFGDFTSIDFMAMRNRIVDAEQGFESLPSKIRNRFDNDPYQLIRWVENPDNKDEAIKLGLLPGAETPQKPPQTVQTDLTVAQAEAALDAAKKAAGAAQA